MPLTEEQMQRFRQFGEEIERLRRMTREIADDMDRAIRESDRRAEEYLPVLRRAGLAPPRRRSRWW
jgi:DNA-binding transcriptional ArsR family regulator